MSCHARDSADLSGDAAYVWGLSFHVRSAAECCQACDSHQAACGQAGSRGTRFWEQRTCGGRGACNAWVFCGSPRCFSYDVHNHTFGECWLKHEPDIASPIAAGPTLPRAMREAPRRQWPWAVSEKLWAGLPPERLQWQSGIVAPRDANVWTNVRLPGWHKGWCKRHGSCGEDEVRKVVGTTS